MRCLRPLLPSALTLLACLPASAQSVLSVRSGVVHFSDGAVFINDQAVESKFGAFPAIQQGSTLRTEQGRAEILLTPGCFLRVDENSAVRMISTSLIDTRVEFLKGSAILDSVNAPSAKGVLLTYKGAEIRFPQQGLYRLDSEPAGVLQVYNGEASVTQDGKVSAIDTSHLFFFSGALQTKKFGEGADDEFYRWAEDRSNAVAEENRLSAQTAGDPADLGNGQSAPIDPNLSLGIPGYGVPSYGTPNYGGPFNTFPLGGSLFGPYNPFGFGFFGAYPAYPPFLFRYPGSALYSRWRDRPRSTNGTSNSRWSSTTNNPRRSSTGVGLSAYRPIRPQTFVSRPLVPPRVYVSPRPATPTFSRGAGVPRPSVTSVGAHPIGHR